MILIASDNNQGICVYKCECDIVYVIVKLYTLEPWADSKLGRAWICTYYTKPIWLYDEN